LTDILLGKV